MPSHPRDPYSARRRPSARAGFTLMEMLVGLVVMSVVIIGVLTLFDQTNQITKSQLNQVDLQQALRVAQNEMVRTVRLAGRGGLLVSPAAPLLPDAGWALKVENNVQGKNIANSGAAPVVDDTDVLTVRGVINTPVYLVDHLDDGSFAIDTGTQTGTIVVRDKVPNGFQDQDLDPLKDMLDEGSRPEALIMVSAFDSRVVAVVEIDYSASSDNGTSITLGFRYAGSAHSAKYAEISTDGKAPGVFPVASFQRSKVGSVGILEEYQFYLRDGRQVEDSTTPLGAEVRKLARARTYPNFDGAWDDEESNLKVDIAENVLDFQVAMAFDINSDGVLTESLNGEGDEWLLNAAADNPDNDPWPAVLTDAPQTLRFLRLTTLARTPEGIRNFEAKEIDRLEDHDISSIVFNPLDPDPLSERYYPRIVLRSVVQMRNL